MVNTGVLRNCILCGTGSHRTDWKFSSNDGKFVACDHHSKLEFDKAVAAARGGEVKPLAQTQASPVGKVFKPGNVPGPVATPASTAAPLNPAPAARLENDPPENDKAVSA